MKQNVIYQGNSVISVETHPEYSHPVVIKKPSKRHPSRRSLRSLEKEYEMTRSLNAVEGVRKALGQHSVENQPALILEYIDGETLRDHIDRKTLSLRTKLEIAVDLTRILGKIHQQDIIHLDLNSENILIGNKDQAVHVIDLGTALRITGNSHQKVAPDQMLGTLPYISPEQTGRINRAVDELSDLYSLGVVLYELMSGRLPFDSKDPMELIHHHIARVPGPPSEVSSEIPEVISSIILKLLTKNAEDRYQSAAGVQADLEKCLQRLRLDNTIEGFPIGEADYTSRFKFPQKLYGRESELKELVSAFKRACRKTSAMMLVSGYSGIGKTALVEELQRTVSQKRGYFIKGKFDQYLRTTSYAGIIQAFAQFVSQILAEPEKNFNEWQEKIQSAVGDLGKVLTEVIPALEELIGAQPNVPQLEGHEAENRFNYLFINFLLTLATEKHPLVLFIDDLQWVDAASLRLLKVIQSDFNKPGLMVIGAYRDNEVDTSHPLMGIIGEQDKKGKRPRILKLDNMQQQHLETLFSDTLSSQKGIKELSTTIYKKTEGNPFFSRRLLSSLHEEGRIRYESETNSWEWDIEDIYTEGIADNVADLLAKKIVQLPEEIKDVLKLAACIGNRFDISTLAMISGLSEPKVLKQINIYLSGQYVIDSGYIFEFVHDQVQQAAYSLLDEKSRMKKHLEIGRLLLAKTSESELDEEIFTIVNHYNLSADLLNEHAEIIQVAELNFQAGCKAKHSSAFVASAEYLKRSASLLTEEAWQEQYPLTLDVYNEWIEASYLSVQYQEVEVLFDKILEHGKQAVDFCIAYQTMILMKIGKNELNEAISIAEDYLEKLQVSFDHALESNLSVEELYNLPAMNDKEKQAAMEILVTIITPMGFMASKRLPSLFYTMLNIISTYGICEVSSFAVTWYATFLCTQGKYQEGNDYGQLGIKLLSKFPSHGMATKIMNMHNAWIRPWVSSVHDTIAPLKEYGYIGIQQGIFEYASYCLGNRTFLMWIIGLPLPVYLKEAEECIRLCERTKQEVTRLITALFTQAALNLSGKPAQVTKLEGEWFSEEHMLPSLEDNIFALTFYRLLKMTLSYLFGDSREAYGHINELLKTRSTLFSHYIYSKISFYSALSCIACLSNTENDVKRREMLERFELFEGELKLWAQSAPMNSQHQYDLVMAEKSRIKKENWKAAQLYEAAIKGAKENKFVHDRALANELFGRFWLEKGYEGIAEMYMREALVLYHQWGAGAKVSQLENSYPQWFKTEAILAGELDSSDSAARARTTISHPIAPIQLDLDSITNASQMLSAETDLEQLLIRMMALVMANSGAEKGVLLLKQENNWFLQARSDVAAEKNDVLLNKPFDPADSDDEGVLVPERVFSYCRRSKEVLVVGDAQLDHRFAEDRMIQKHNIKSMACIPTLYRGELKAMLYLENRLVPEVFTLERVEILKHLSSQFGVSVENALLYDSLTQAEAKYRTVADFTYDWEHWEKVDGTMEYISPSCERISGYTARDLQDNPSLLREIIIPQDREIWDKHCLDAREKLKPREIQFRIQRRDGQIRWIEHICQPVTDDQGRQQGFRASNRDISNRKQAEIELRGAYAEIEQLKNQLEAESAYLQDEIKLEHNFENIIGHSEGLKYVLHRVEQVAPTDSPVLIMGETGTGKELMARALHKLSPHSKRALVKVNCAALPGELIESELFGREKGAFTGATTTQFGRFELAKGSTLFLDEIGELPLELQAKLLRVLESGEFERLGSPRTLHSDARIIAATNRVLEEEVRKGRFREDLWYRLKVFPITVPPLREHPEDIPLLVKWFVDQLAIKMGKHVAEIPKRTMQMLQGYPWPGNVRELKHAVEAALITAQGKKLNFELPQIAETALSDFKSFEEMERDYILGVLKAKNWKIGGANSAASTLGMHVNTLRGRMKKLGIKRPKP